MRGLSRREFLDLKAVRRHLVPGCMGEFAAIKPRRLPGISRTHSPNENPSAATASSSLCLIFTILPSKSYSASRSAGLVGKEDVAEKVALCLGEQRCSEGLRLLRDSSPTAQTDTIEGHPNEGSLALVCPTDQ